MRLRANVEGMVSADELDPTFVALYDELKAAREQYEEVAAAATGSWGTLQAGATEAVQILRGSVESASDQIEKIAQG